MVFEITSSGHRLDYVHRIMEVLSSDPRCCPVLFVLGADFEGRLDERVLATARTMGRVEVRYMTSSETARCQSRFGLLRKVWTYRTFDRYLCAADAEVGFASYLDTLLPGLALRRGRSSARVAGILFRPTVHYPQLAYRDGVIEAVSRWERFRRMVEGVILRAALGNSRLEYMLSLDPYFADFAQSGYRQGRKVRHLPEPYSADRVVDRPPTDDRTTFLLFGGIGERKGILQLLEALERLSVDDAKLARVVVAGRIQERIQPAIAEVVHRLVARSPLQMEFHDRFIPDEELEKLVERAHVVLAPYRRHVGSSGVLVWAASRNRPVIAQEYGLVGALVRHYRLGLVCDPEEPQQLADCIRRCLHERLDDLAEAEGMAAYAASNGPHLFSAVVAGSLAAS